MVPRERAHKTTLVNCLSLVIVCFMRESLVLTERAHKQLRVTGSTSINCLLSHYLFLGPHEQRSSGAR